jgi:hypothetical protein
LDTFPVVENLANDSKKDLFDQDGAPFEQTSNIDNGPVKMTQ